MNKKNTRVSFSGPEKEMTQCTALQGHIQSKTMRSQSKWDPCLVRTEEPYQNKLRDDTQGGGGTSCVQTVFPSLDETGDLFPSK